MIEISIEKDTGMVFLNQYTIGRDAENLQKTIKFKFKDEFVDGTARLEYAIKGQKYLQILTKGEDSYNIPIRSVMLHKGEILMQLVVVEPSDRYELTKDTEIVIGKTYFTRIGDEDPFTYEVVENLAQEDLESYYELVDIPVFKSNVFKMYCDESINAEQEAPSEYPSWLDIISTKLASLDEAVEEANNLDLDAERVEDGVEVTITKKDGTTKTVKVNDGQGGSGGTGDYEELTNKPKINNVELHGNKTLEDLGLQPAGDYVDDSNYVHTDNNFTTLEKQKLSTLENYDDTEIKEDIAGLTLSKVSTSTKVNNKALDSDITLTASDIGLGNVFLLKGSKSTIEDLPSTGNQIGDVWYVESEEVGYIWLEKSGVAQWEQLGLPIDLSNYYTKTEANALLADKQDELVSGTNIKTVNNQSLLGSGNVNVSSYNGFTWTGTQTAADVALFQEWYNDYLATNVPKNIIFNEYGSPSTCITYIYNTSDYVSVLLTGGNPRTSDFDKYPGFFSKQVRLNMTGTTITSILAYSTNLITVAPVYQNSTSPYASLGISNTKAYTPTQPTHPATKGYVDGLVGDIETLLGGI